MRLGEALVRDGVITQEELDHALGLQTAHGGKLGTLLVELGHLDQKKLYEYLSRRFAGAHIFPPGEEPTVTRDAVAAVPKKIASYYRLVPIAVDAHAIHVALLDPTRLSALSAVKSATAKKVVPHVVSEDVIDVMLLKHYGIDPAKRALKIRKAPIELTAQADDADLPLADAAELLEEILDDEPALDLDVRRSIGAIEPAAARAAIDAATIDEQIVMALLGAALTVFQRAALFRVARGGAGLFGWDAGGSDVSRRAFATLSVTVHARSIFGVALSGRAPFLGSIARTTENVAAFAGIGWTMPRSAFCLSLGKTALLYGDNGPDSQVSVNVNEVMALAALAAGKL